MGNICCTNTSLTEGVANGKLETAQGGDPRVQGNDMGYVELPSITDQDQESGAPSMTELTLSDMLPELLSHIFSFCSGKDLLNLLLVQVEGSCILGELSDLVHLELSGIDLRDSGLHEIFASTMQFESLFLHDCRISFSDIILQSSLKKLEFFVVYAEGYHLLTELSNLTQLILYYPRKIKVSAFQSIFSSDMKLDDLRINGCRGFGDITCSDIALQTSLEILEFRDVDARDYHCLSKLSNLTYLDLSDTEVKDSDIQSICCSDIKLNQLSLDYCYCLTDIAYTYIAMQHNLTNLGLSATKVNDAGIERICSSSMKLDFLRLDGCGNITNKACSYISKQHCLKILWLSNTPVDHSGIAAICSSRMRLDQLKLDGCCSKSSTALDCSEIAKQTSLTKLELEAVQIKGYHDLEKLKNLEHLNVMNTIVGNDDAEKMRSLCPRLKTILHN